MTEEEYKKKKLELYRKIVNDQNFDKKDVTDNDLCKLCDGGCCKHFPCAFLPDDFVDVDDFNYMKTILDTGFFVIDRFYHYPSKKVVYYIRSRGVLDKDIILKKSVYYNTCLLLEENGCIFDFYTRPSIGALVKPKRDGIFTACSLQYTDEQIGDDWLKHQKILLKLRRHYIWRRKSPNESKILKLERIIRQDEI